ncbi:MAG: DEAD/DEAH box helicase family protein [Peptococcaceae bacterium]|nr:DEAD/DEAH box helicase family protein [Peptococcaceae bacterium]
MRFKFDANQDYQLRAIEAVVGLFEGQRRMELTLDFEMGGLAAVPNKLELSDALILDNLKRVQDANGISPDTELKYIEEEIETAEGTQTVCFPNFSVEMETGTGKTYVYLRTLLELYRQYGFLKYIIVVPSVAIREGILKTLKITEQHFRELYHNQPYRYYEYHSENLNHVRQFSLGNQIEIMVMTIDSFNKDTNVINQSTDRLQGETPIHLIQAARPILILDEPQNMESGIARAALARLNPLLALRYSATHRNPYNLVYRLTPAQAYREGLVKRIEVASVIEENNYNHVFVQLEDIRVQKSRISAKVKVHKQMANGTVKEKTVTVKPGDNLKDKTGRIEYDTFVVEEINPGTGTIVFTNGVELKTGEAQGPDKEAIFRAQIAYTIEQHFRAQRRLRDQGIKVLSLFFIDRVENYLPEDGIIRRLFVEEFNRLKAKYPEWADADPEQVQGSYFSEYKSERHMQNDKAAFDLIMKDKEKLMSFEESTCFIFSHSALREGWDNPNVFIICTLNQTVSNIKKRQEIGRGVRLAVNQEGTRIKDEQVNVLTVVANESYKDYVAKLQTEYIEEYGPGDTPPPPPDARKRGKARLRKEYMLKPEFKELWERIKHKTRYAVKVDTERLIADCAAALDRATIRSPQIIIQKAQVDMTEGLHMEARYIGGGAVEDLSGRYPLPNIVDWVQEETRLTRPTVLEILRRMEKTDALAKNPYEFATTMVRVIKEKLADHLVNGIQYRKIDDYYLMELFTDIEKNKQYLIPAEKSIYDHVVYESGPERAFVEGLENRDDVKLYVKLPNWFVVPTPVGDYNPDWAIVVEETDQFGKVKDRLYLVRETKGTSNRDELRPQERRKVDCGEKHFKALGVDYKVVAGIDELLP